MFIRTKFDTIKNIKKKVEIMVIEVKKSEGPLCACGRVDLYEEMLKQQETSKTKDIDKKKSDEFIISVIDSDKKIKKQLK